MIMSVICGMYFCLSFALILILRNFRNVHELKCDFLIYAITNYLIMKALNKRAYQLKPNLEYSIIYYTCLHKTPKQYAMYNYFSHCVTFYSHIILCQMHM